MVYRDARIESTVTSWGEIRDAMTYAAAEKGHVVRKSTYGGLLTENVVQAICRDIQADAMVRLDRAGFALVLHVHDETAAEVADASDLERLIKIMTTPPPWAAGVPLAAEGYVDTRYRGK
jgi:DNA polymerase